MSCSMYYKRDAHIQYFLKVEVNERIAMKAVDEADERRQQNRLIEKMLQKCNQEFRLIRDQNELKLQKLLDQIDTKGKTSLKFGIITYYLDSNKVNTHGDQNFDDYTNITKRKKRDNTFEDKRRIKA
ncbi:unnamed protein product [Lupinus luteus]|uniref:Uncharacterized protein n=1 Tax=Lupinus luteus TaxID=3873 RepID=A0AAV1WPN4_LUPLU